jgi:hypothetical protein
VDSANGKLFWSDWLGGTADRDKIRFNASVLSSPVDAAQVQPVATSAFFNPPADFPDGVPGCDRDGTYKCPPAGLHAGAGGQLPITHLGKPSGVSVDSAHQMLYWSDQSPPDAGPKLMRASYDGVTTPPKGIVVDGIIGDVVATAVDNKDRIYWVENVNARTDADGNFLIGHQIRRANMDGSNLKVLGRDFSRAPTGFALDLHNGHFYWTEYVGGLIARCPLEEGCPEGDWGGVSGDRFKGRSKPEIVLETFEGGENARYTAPKLGGITLDPERNAMYWTEDHTMAPPPGEDTMIWGGMVKRANLDGTAVKELFRHTASNEVYEATPVGIGMLRS